MKKHPTPYRKFQLALSLALITLISGLTSRPPALADSPEATGDGPAALTETITGQNVVFTINYLTTSPCTPWPAQAQAALNYAVSIWAGLLDSSVPVEIDACWFNMGGSDLGGGGANGYRRDFTGAPLPDTDYPIALANKLAQTDLNGSEAEIFIDMNSGLGGAWYFGTNGHPGSHQIDFVTVAVHEIGHGLGFNSSFGFLTGGNGEHDTPPRIFDRFVVNGAGQSLLNAALFPNPSPALGNQLRFGPLFFDGPATRAANGGQPARLQAEEDVPADHLDESTYRGNPNGLMTPIIADGEAIHQPGPIVMGAMRDMGWFLDTSPKLAVGGISSNPFPVLMTTTTIDFQLTLRNTGYLPASGIQVINTLPANTTYVNGSASNGGVHSAGQITWSALTLAGQSSLNLTFRVNVVGSLHKGDLLINTLQATSSQGANIPPTQLVTIVNPELTYLPVIIR
ncbi:MAG: hypothetical protein U0401_04525 [Anaerolineae bacterium]